MVRQLGLPAGEAVRIFRELLDAPAAEQSTTSDPVPGAPAADPSREEDA
jgi:hypothetical protein